MELYREFYGDAPFVRVIDVPPSTKPVAGTNYCLVHPSLSPQTGKVVVTSALDNLGKGAAGAMVQCFNIMRGLPEDAGLRALGLFP
jgi:N-acetyl-gamma-glutamyl-phosphate reductase